jgi:hypothetical protein
MAEQSRNQEKEEPMTGFHAHADPPRTFGDRLEQLNENLHSLSVRLKDAIANAVSIAVGDAIRDAVRSILGKQESPPLEESYSRPPDRERDSWEESAEFRWNEEDDYRPRPEEHSTERNHTPSRWSNALSMAAQTALWWLQQQPRRRPVLTTTIVAVAAGVTAFIAGPALAAGVGVFASAVGLLMTANAAKTAGEHLRTLTSG